MLVSLAHTCCRSLPPSLEPTIQMEAPQPILQTGRQVYFPWTLWENLYFTEPANPARQGTNQKSLGNWNSSSPHGTKDLPKPTKASRKLWIGAARPETLQTLERGCKNKKFRGAWRKVARTPQLLDKMSLQFLKALAESFDSSCRRPPSPPLSGRYALIHHQGLSRQNKQSRGAA